MLSNFVSVELIQLDIIAEDWHEAIVKSAKPLLDQGKIKNSYIEGIIKSVEENGPYFVLLPKVALPHARPENGALEDAIGITVLRESVEFGNKDNDPVKYLFTLSATTNENHLKALSVLAELFENQEFFNILDNANTSQEVHDYIKNKERRENYV